MSEEEAREVAAAPPSSFVSVLAWVFIALSSLATLVALLQNLMVWLLLHGSMQETMRDPPAEGMPAFATFALRHMDLFFLAFLLVSATTLAASIGLLRRREWARRLFIGLMLLAAAWQLVGLALQFALMPPFAQLPPQAPADFAADFRTMSIAMIAFGSVIGLAFCALFLWIAWRLASAAVRAEFAAVR